MSNSPGNNNLLNIRGLEKNNSLINSGNMNWDDINKLGTNKLGTSGMTINSGPNSLSNSYYLSSIK